MQRARRAVRAWLGMRGPPRSPVPEPPPSPDTFPRWAYEPRDFFRFEVVHQSEVSNARVGRIHTPHGVIDTPSFVPVATNGALKAVDFRAADATGNQLMFCNTLHLMLRPGTELIRRAGGIHRFANRNGPIITDSGGFQVFSLSGRPAGDEGTSLARRRMPKSLLKVRDEGALFSSYVDGQRILLTPESSVRAQKDIGADIIVPLDELVGADASEARAAEAVHRSHRWEARSLQEHLNNIQQQAMYCVVHGGTDMALRKMSLEYLSSLPFDGIAVGGNLGRDREEMLQMLEHLMPLAPAGKPRHLLGIADTESIQRAVPHGLDTFDSCYPTRIARHGLALTAQGKLKLARKSHESEFIPIDESCSCSTCQNHTRAYLRHLVKAKEPVAATLLTIHNLQFMNDMMASIRDKILQNKI